jgi:tetratricopeptide (TPR) repeat protein
MIILGFINANSVKMTHSIINTTFLVVSAFLLTFSIELSGQCNTWNDNPRKNDALDQHALYRDALKMKDYSKALTHWQQAYEIAPSADGKRDWHFTDGIDIYIELFKAEADQEVKKTYFEKIMSLYEQAETCLNEGSIQIDGFTSEERIAYLEGRKAFNMFYYLSTPYSKTLATMERAMELAGDKTEYIVLDPAARVAVYQFQKEYLDAAKAREIHERLNAIADYNIANNEKYQAQYQQVKESLNAVYAQIERQIYDCDYFKPRFEEEFEMDPENYERIKEMYAILVQQGCDEEDPVVKKLGTVWKEYAERVNAERQAEFEANNPGVAARRLYEAGDYEGAIQKYEEAIEKEEDDETKAEYYFGIASIQFRQLDAYSAARSSARKAAELKSGWGRPYMLIGDMYVKSASSCGKDAYTRGLVILAALDKYSYAKSVDSEVAEEASKRIGRYSDSMPPKEDVFMRGMEGKSEKISCWIGETVKVRYND